MDIPYRVPPRIEPYEAGKGCEPRSLNRTRPQRFNRVENFHAAHVDYNPEDIGLPHEEGEYPKKDGPDAAHDAAPTFPRDAAQMVPIRNKYHDGRKNIRIVQGREEEKCRKEGDVGG